MLTLLINVILTIGDIGNWELVLLINVILTIGDVGNWEARKVGIFFWVFFVSSCHFEVVIVRSFVVNKTV